MMMPLEKLRAYFNFMRLRNRLGSTNQKRVALIVGSGPSAPSLSKRLPRETVLIAVNNAWLIKRNFDYLIYPSDFPPDRLPQEDFTGSLISNNEYMPAIDVAGGIIFCGATMAFAAGYWAIKNVKPEVLGYYASDMVYNKKSGSTHFYGQGTPDPLRKDISLGSLEARSARLFCWGLMNGTLIVNHSRELESRLVFPRLTIDDHNRSLGHQRKDLELCWRSLLESARELRKREAAVPFDALRHDYWRLENNLEAVNCIQELDARWLQLVPEIARGWEIYNKADL